MIDLAWHLEFGMLCLWRIFGACMCSCCRHGSRAYHDRLLSRPIKDSTSAVLLFGILFGFVSWALPGEALAFAKPPAQPQPAPPIQAAH